MTKSDLVEKELAAYHKGTFGDLEIQDAFIIVAVYAAQLDYNNCEADIKRIKKILENHPQIVARKKGISSLVNKFVNAMQGGDRDDALTIATDTLTPELRQTAFELALDVAPPGRNLSKGRQKMLNTLKARLFISDESAEQAVRNKIEMRLQSGDENAG